MRRPRVLVALVVSITLVTAGAATSPATAQVAPTVTVTADPNVAQYTDLSSCGAAAEVQMGVFELTRDDATTGVSVEYSLSGDARYGTDYVSDPLRLGHVDLLAGETTATIPVEPVSTLQTGRALTLSIESGPDHQVGSPASATITFALAVADCAAPPVPTPAVPQALAPAFTG